MPAFELGDHLPDFLFGQNSGQAPWSFGPHQFDGQIQIFPQYLAVQEEQRAEGLILCRSSHVVLTCQGGEKLADSLLQPMSLVVVEDKALGPIDAGFPRAVGTVLEPYCIAYLVEQSPGSPRYASLRQSGFAYRARF